MTFDGGQNWSTPTYINAKDGEKGDDGYWTNKNILKALESVNQDGLFYFPNGTGDNGKLGINASVIRAALASFNQLQMDPGANYNGVSDKTFNGGYISFAIPSPFEPLPNGNYPCLSGSKPGWRARLGYLRGNGDMQTATAGIGFAIYTDATWDDKYASLTCSDGTESKNKHLVLSTLMLTQSGLGMLTVQNTNYGGTNPQLWMDNDILMNSNNTQVPHYGYRYWGGEKIINRWNRLWLDEHNGCLYWSNGSTSLKRWKNPSET